MASPKEITIAGKTFSVLQPYDAGHTLTEAEAKALNQVRAENIRNNMASKVKAAYEGTAKEGEPTAETIAKAVADYDSSYEFTLASVGGGKRATDPIEIEALSIARSMFADHVKAKLKATVKAVKEKIGEDTYNAKIAEIAARDEVVKEAKRRVKARQAAAESALDGMDLDGIGAAPTEDAPAE